LDGTISPIQEELYQYSGTLDPPKPRLPQINIIDGGVFGERVKKHIFCFGLLGRCLSPLTLVCA